MNKIPDLLELEKITHVSQVDERSAALREEIVRIKGEHAARGILNSGATLKRIADARASMFKSVIEGRLASRREFAKLNPELLSDEHLNQLKADCIHIADGLANALQTASDLPLALPAVAHDQYVLPLKQMVGREIRKLQLEGKLAVKPANKHFVLNISNSVVTGLNLGSIVGDMNTSVDSLTNQGNADLAEALKLLAEGFAADEQLGDSRRDILEVLSVIGEQARTVPEERKLGIIKASIQHIGTVVAIAAHSSGLWMTWGPQIQKFFGM